MKLIEQAVAAHRAGRLGEAEALYRQVLAGNKRDFDALHMLSIIHAQRRDFVEAEKLLRNALAVDDRVPPALHNFGNVLSMLKRYDEAVAVYDRALQLMPTYAPVYSDRGNAKRGLGRPDAALPDYTKALELNPNDPATLGNLAQALMDLARHDEAADMLRRALAVSPNHPTALKLMGRLAFERGDLTGAVEQLQRAIALKPDQPDAYLVMGNALRDLGRLDEARQAYAKAIEVDPANAPAYLGLSEITPFAAGDGRLKAMEGLATKATGLSRPDRMMLDFALAKAYADLADHERSFRHMRAANAAKRATINYDEKAVLASFDQIEQVFSPELIAEKSDGGDPSNRPIFIIGMPRSGMTLIEQMLASHPAVHGGGELTTFSEATAARVGTTTPFPDFVPILDRAALTTIGANYVNRTKALEPDKERVTDKLALNFLFAGLIHLALPNAVIIHCRRDPIDTCLSVYSRLFRPNEYNYAYHLGELGRYFMRYERLMEHWARVLPQGRMLEVRYEDVVADLEGQSRRILDHCRLPWDERVLAFHRTERPVPVASAAQVRTPLYHSAVGRWRGYEKYLGPLLAELQPAEATAR
jgi:tetratricopeptide (TPR) repeat protein